jgi:hypothetical protein
MPLSLFTYDVLFDNGQENGKERNRFIFILDKGANFQFKVEFIALKPSDKQ